jgi:hypothetical protein
VASPARSLELVGRNKKGIRPGQRGQCRVERLGLRARAENCVAQLGPATARFAAAKFDEPALPRGLPRRNETAVVEIVRWKDDLPAEKQWLFVGVKVGWESAIGMGSYYYPDGNAYVDKDPENDAQQKSRPQILPGRGFQPIGYAAVSTAGLAKVGELQEAHLAEIVRRHLADLSEQVHRAGMPRDQIFTHCGGWAEGEKLYRAALNEHSCPGWSFYRHGRDPRGDKTAMAALAASDAPYWAAVEWLPIGARTSDEWHAALRNTLTTDRCRYVCIYNWRQVSEDETAREGIRRALSEPLPIANQ